MKKNELTVNMPTGREKVRKEARERELFANYALNYNDANYGCSYILCLHLTDILFPVINI